MSFLLKIVEGPNAGAEIALVEGLCLSVGRSEECDIVLNDASLPAKAFELEVSGERVIAVTSEGKDVKMEPFHVVRFGTTSVVVGPSEGRWKDLVWPAPEVAAEDNVDDGGAEAVPGESAAPAPPRRSLGCFVFILLLVLLAAGAAFLWYKYPEETKPRLKAAWSWCKEFCRKCKRDLAPAKPVKAPPEALEKVADDCGFTITGGGTDRVSVRGDFATRSQRLEATARVYAAKPGTSVDFTDAESLRASAEELLNIVPSHALAVAKVEGRKVFLKGAASSREALKRVITALNADVPKIESADCSAVVVGQAAVPAANQASDRTSADDQRYAIPRVRAERTKPAASARPETPAMPVAGILTVPYPCLVLVDGTRVLEGASFGEYVVEKIKSDSVVIRGGEGRFVWRP